jgi:hypothetical protein
MARDPFEVLGVARDASLAEARDAYRRTAELFHPDRLRTLRDAVRAEGERRLREANEAMRAVQRSFGRPLNAATASPLTPSDAATEAEARLYDAQLRQLDRDGAYVPGSKVVWGGDAARAVLTRLRHEFRRDEGPIRMVDWGSYRIDLPGSAMAGFLRVTLGIDDTAQASAPAPRGALGDRLPVVTRSVAVPATLADAIVGLRVEVTYSLTADVY